MVVHWTARMGEIPTRYHQEVRATKKGFTGNFGKSKALGKMFNSVDFV